MKKLWSEKKWTKALAVLLACLALAFAVDAVGGSLAQPERTGPETDRFVGFHLVLERMPEEGEEIKMSYDGWVDYGTEQLHVEGLGKVSLLRKILIGTYNEEDRRYEFPGLEGLNCFLAVQTLSDGAEHYTGYTDLADVKITEGEKNSLEGTAYFGPPLDDSDWNTADYDYGWTAYQVYQMADGTIYLDGSGSSYGGMGGFTISREESWTDNWDGEERAESFEVTFKLQSVERTQSVEVSWFGEENQVVEERTLSMEEIGEGLTLERPQGAVWALVEQTDRLGAVQRAAYTLGEEGAAHRLVQLDERGQGAVVYLSLS